VPDLVFLCTVCTFVICTRHAEGRTPRAYVSSQLYVWFDGSTLGAGIVAAEVHRWGGELVISEH
jgi:hypothetical protein